MSMSPLLPGEHGRHVTLLVRSYSLRRRAEEVLERAASLRQRSGHLLGTSRVLSSRYAGDDAPSLEDAEALQWYRVQIRQMLAAGWSEEELADVGITDSLLRELGLRTGE